MPTRIPVPFLGRRRDSSSERAAVRDSAGSSTRKRNLFAGQPKRQLSSSTSATDIAPAESEKHFPTPTQMAEADTSLLAAESEPDAMPLSTSARPMHDLNSQQYSQHSHPKHQRTWRKLLYIKQDYPDDYVDETFLMELQKNTNVQLYDYSATAMQTNVVTQHLSSIMIFIAVFIELYRGKLTGDTLLWFSSTLTVLSFVFWDCLNIFLRMPEQRIVRFNVIKGALFIALLLFGLSPILRTLTEDTSSDTIWAMTVILFCVNLAFHDYSTGNLTNIRFPGSVSLNAAVLASVLLASQLDSNLSVFAFLSFAIKWFALFPIFRRYLKRISVAASIATTVVIVLVATAMFTYISRAIALLFVFSTLFITFGCPLWLIWVQRYKNEIHGPWDEARPIVHHYYH
ncbi:glycosylphosphatidylinositol anchor biosynthesis [Coemansia spiralis]|uniref:Glycosylphosphatidylinositol anchor biosynthesis n=2 Tax=Coemansia TaxID=4863 RepID=A0A9W8L129_9FUNG|nr:phosphatidylinositol N-acetylglucosaminyltransferase-domain-containing protein [Coemansia spiralis]KAJ1995732.1 glycosylphosphatidylinositol anchor biosynthesis [Coemansia umbellata]KAJ2623664.1 glycosylphosphatidylinositol anchor biosynthesis [Coemansia sp. RSA 1358]KAJ2680417.1 glycosylphosphatidylinositol anchor biosynthesis [Coemansia spiralis]